MSWRVRIESFEGPFDLLLHLVSRQKVDVGAISISRITDQYLAEVARMERLDLDVASDFLLVASTLLALKAESLLPRKREVWEEELEEVGPFEAREILIERLLLYKQFKNAAEALCERACRQARLHARTFGPDAALRKVTPDYLEGVSLDTLGTLAAGALLRRNIALLDSEHIAEKTLPLEQQVKAVHGRIKEAGAMRLSQLVSADDPVRYKVVTFLALLELYKRGLLDLRQSDLFGEIELSYCRDGGELLVDDQHGLSSLKEEER